MFPGWKEADELAASCLEQDGAVTRECYRLGEAFLRIATADASFGDRFREVYGDSRAGPEADFGPIVECAVREHPERPFALVSFTDPEPLEAVGFVTSLFASRGCRELGPARGWRVVGVGADDDGTWAFAGERVLVRRDRDWQGLVANCAVHRVIRLQRRVLFLHAGAVAVGGRGVLLIGAKGAGKTTLSLAMAAQGHGFLGDEIGAVQLERRALLPVPRSVSVRDGPRHARVDRRLAELGAPRVRVPDGSERLRASASDVVPLTVRGPVPLGAVVFLDGFASQPSAARVAPDRAWLARLNPLGSTLWGVPPAERVFRIAGLLDGLPLLRLHAGPPESTAGLLTATLESMWA